MDRRTFLGLLAGSVLFPGVPRPREVWTAFHCKNLITGETLYSEPLTRSEFDKSLESLWSYGEHPKYMIMSPTFISGAEKWRDDL